MGPPVDAGCFAVTNMLLSMLELALFFFRLVISPARPSKIVTLTKARS